MISISKLLCGSENFGDILRYSPSSGKQIHGAAAGHGPVVVWNMTRSCNLRCIHCYASAGSERHPGELSTGEARKFIDGLAEFKVPVLLFSGGEPLMRPDFFELAEYAAGRNIRPTVSTNGTLVTLEVARRLKEIGVGYVGISLDGTGEGNDRFRGKKGAFEAALEGIRHCLEVGQRVGLRFTINRHNYHQLADIFDLIEKEKIPRVCFYHLVYSGRGREMVDEDITHAQSRAALDLIMEKTVYFHRRGMPVEILTVDNHADGVYIYLKLLREDPARAEQVYRLLKQNGGNRTGIAIAAVDWEGYVHPDQFTMHHTFGNVRKKSFGEIWTDLSQPILAGLKNRRPLLKGRCARCRWLDLCNGNFRSRAEAVYNDFWAPDPACYLTDEEIGAA
ncbi:MAG TPA: putative heme d1 biosynthesis radical SAM protein NirJ1 [Desulfotomaculum sp.]|nr:putative heme d1 biosynthesis radical SAM protein NirJ1 [Desulfotomaculum sp.]